MTGLQLRQAIPALVSAVCLAGCETEPSPLMVGQTLSVRVEVSAPAAEELVSIPVAEGQAVAAGDPLFTLDQRVLIARLAATRAREQRAQAWLDELTSGPRAEAIAASRSRLAAARETLTLRRAEYQRAQALRQKNLASEDERDRTLREQEVAEARFAEAQAGLEELLNGTRPETLAQAEAELAEVRAQAAEIEALQSQYLGQAPADARVDRVLFEVGERPRAGDPVVVLLRGPPRVRFFVPEAQRVDLSPGAPLSVRIDGLTDPLSATLRWVSGEPTFTPYYALTEHDRGRLAYEAEADLLEPPANLPDGVPVEVLSEAGDAPG